MIKGIIKKPQFILKVILFIFILLLIILLFNHKKLLLLSLSNQEHSSKINIFKENYEYFACLKDFVIENYDSDELIDNIFYYDDSGILHYRAIESITQSECQNNAVNKIKQSYEKENQWYLNRWYCDGKYVVVYDECNAFRFVYSIDGRKPDCESDEHGEWKRSKSIKDNWYYMYYNYET